jgi:hypothetical protein
VRNLPLLAILALALPGCRSPAPKGQKADDSATQQDSETDTAPDSETAEPQLPEDRDSDGYTEDVDCDDTDPRISPAATEVWNDQDDDCDGLIDADGRWIGTIAMAASAIYEGAHRDFSLACPFEGTREAGTLHFAITCTPDPTDALAQLLLGETLVVTEADARVSGTEWSDTVMYTSSSGWDSRGEGVIAWSAVDAAAVNVSISGVSLAASGTGSITRTD